MILSEQDLAEINLWCALMLERYRNGSPVKFGVCAYDKQLPTHSIRSTIETLLKDVRALQAGLRDARAEIDRWGHGDFHYGDMPRDPGVLAALEAIDNLVPPVR